MRGFRHISTRLICWTLGGTAAALALIGLHQQRQTRQLVLNQVAAQAAAVSIGIKEEVQGVLRSVEASVRLTAARAVPVAPERAGIETLLREMIATNRIVYGGTVAYEPFAVPAGRGRLAPYVFQQDAGFGTTDLATPQYSYWDQSWFREPLEKNAPVWTEPYFDQGAGNIHMVTFAQPFTRPGDTRPAGVVTGDVSLAWLKRVAESNQPGRNGYVVIFSGSGRIVSHPHTKYIQAESLDSLAAQLNQPELAFIGREVAAGRGGSLNYESKIFRQRVRVDFQPVRVGGWGVIVGYDEEEFLAPVRSAGRVAFGSALASLLVLAGLVVLVSRRITRPLQELADIADRMATGDLAVAIPPARTRDEIGHLTDAFIRMRDDLRRHIADLATTTAAKQKLESELAIAQQIQRTMLPAPSHTARGRHTARIHTQIGPAKVVGGDLYVYFPVGPGRLFFAAGDVSDKGVPAALFMARTITLLRTIARGGADPGEVLRRVNAELCPDNEECMFVTLFCGILDLDSGELVAASAGHEAPILVAAGGAPVPWEIPAGPALALHAEFEITAAHRTLAPGDLLLLYTDGVTDAVDPAGTQFTAAGLLQAVARLDRSAADPAEQLLHDVQAFAAGAPQPDDITLLSLRFD